MTHLGTFAMAFPRRFRGLAIVPIGGFGGVKKSYTCLGLFYWNFRVTSMFFSPPWEKLKKSVPGRFRHISHIWPVSAKSDPYRGISEFGHSSLGQYMATFGCMWCTFIRYLLCCDVLRSTFIRYLLYCVCVILITYPWVVLTYIIEVHSWINGLDSAKTMRHWLCEFPLFCSFVFLVLEIYLDKNIGRIAPAFFAINSILLITLIGKCLKFTYITRLQRRVITSDGYLDIKV